MSVECLVSAERLSARVVELGAALTEGFDGRRPVLLGVLNGAFPFLADLARAMDCELEIDFLALTRFGEGGRVRLALDSTTDLAGRDVILVEDIVDTGLTLRSLLAQLETRSPRSVTTVTLLDKVTRRLVTVPVDHAGFTIGDEFVVGYGLDWEGWFRNLPGLWVVLDFPAFAANPTGLHELARAEDDRGGNGPGTKPGPPPVVSPNPRHP